MLTKLGDAQRGEEPPFEKPGGVDSHMVGIRKELVAALGMLLLPPWYLLMALRGQRKQEYIGDSEFLSSCNLLEQAGRDDGWILLARLHLQLPACLPGRWRRQGAAGSPSVTTQSCRPLRAGHHISQPTRRSQPDRRVGRRVVLQPAGSLPWQGVSTASKRHSMC